jgi:hypothetical protein
MSTINYTYNVIVDRFRQFAAGHFQLRRFTHGEISQADLEKEAEWPWLHVKPRAINYSPGTRSFQFEIFISDLPRDKEDKTGYQAESITDCSLIFQDLINEIYLGNMFGSDVLLTRPVNAEPFVEQYTHTLTGVTGTIELSLDYDWSACSIPASWNYNTPTDSPSDGWGALQFIESLDQNGVYVSLLNDEEAPGNSYYYGTDAEGVKGWHAIVDNIGLTCETLPECATIISILDDIEALQEDKANTADLGATAFSNNYNDLDNLPTIPAAQIQSDWTQANNAALDFIKNKPTIPAAQVNSDWNATSGVAQILNKPTIPSIAGLVPETRTLTINGTTQDLSANRTFTIATGLTVGTTPITSGTVGRVLFEGTGNVLQQSGSLFWDNTNGRLGIGTASPTASIDARGSIRATGPVSTTRSIEMLYDESVGSMIRTNVYTLIHLVADTNKLATFQSSGILFPANSSKLIGNTNRNLIEVYSETTGKLTAKTTGAWNLELGTNDTIRQTIFGSTGNIGINTTTDAGFKLDVNGRGRFIGATAASGLVVTGGPSGNDVNLGGIIFLGTDTFYKGSFIYSYDSKLLTINGGDVDGNIAFKAATNERMRINSSGNVLINTTTNIASSKLTVESTTQGFLPPRMTTTQKNAIASPAAGLVVYDTTLGKLCVRGASSWETITSI